MYFCYVFEIILDPRKCIWWHKKGIAFGKGYVLVPTTGTHNKFQFFFSSVFLAITRERVCVCACMYVLD